MYQLGLAPQNCSLQFDQLWLSVMVHSLIVFTELLMTNFAYVFIIIIPLLQTPCYLGCCHFTTTYLISAFIGYSSPVKIYVSGKCNILFRTSELSKIFFSVKGSIMFSILPPTVPWIKLVSAYHTSNQIA